MVLEKTLESPLDCKEIQPVHPKGNQPWIFIGRTDAEAETPILWPPDAKTLMLGNIEGGRRRGRQRMRWLDGITDLMDMSLSKLQGSLACCSPWGCKESDTTEQLNWNDSVKNVPTMQETQVLFLGQEDPLEKRMATHSSILAWRIPWTEEPARVHWVAEESDTTEHPTHSNMPPLSPIWVCFHHALEDDQMRLLTLLT